VSAGRITIRGLDTTNLPPGPLRTHGVGHIPEDRHTHGMVASYTIADNLVLNAYDQQPFARRHTRRQTAIVQHAERLLHEFDIRAPGVFTQTGSLSGGNQQKLVVARECARPLTLLIAAQPTRGLDVGATAFVQQRLLQQRDQGCAVLLISTELDEILALADRIAVLYRGQFTTPRPAAEVSRQRLGQLMAGLHDAP
jgi:simple sugar transport system ATP-binding protein